MRKSLVLVALLAVIISPAACQQTAPVAPSKPQALPADAPTREQVLKLVNPEQARKTITAVADMLRQQIAQGIQSEGGSAEEIKVLQETIDGLFNNLPIDDIVNAVVPVYQQHFTASDIDAVAAFNNGPVGQKVINSQTQLMGEMLQAMTPEKSRELALQPLPPNAPTAEQIQKLFDAIEMRKNLEQIIAGIRSQSTSIAADTLKSNGATPDEIAKVKTRDEPPLDPVIHLTMLIYQHHFTASEITAMTDFYESPVGKKFQAAQPDIAAATMRAEEPIIRKMMETIIRRMSELEAQRKAGVKK